MSVPQSFDQKCAVIFKGKKATVHHNNKILMKAKRSPTSNLWCMSTTLTVDVLDTNFKNFMFSAITLPNKERTRFLYADLFYLPTSTLRKALNKGFLITWPRMDIKYRLKEADDY